MLSLRSSCLTAQPWQLPQAESVLLGPTKEIVVDVMCDVILMRSATPPQIAALGDALWRWSGNAAAATSIYDRVNDQALSDLISGKVPFSWNGEPRGAHFKFWDRASKDRRTTIDRLRQEIPVAGVADVLVDGRSWSVVE